MIPSHSRPGETLPRDREGGRGVGVRLEDACAPGLIRARSWLFVPGDRPDRFVKAATGGADMVICDLEDGVPGSQKAFARESVRSWLDTDGQACVRINGPQSAWIGDDLAALKGLPGLRGVVVPKAEDPDVLRAVHEDLGPNVSLVALLESALGVQRVVDMATAPGVVRLAFGSIDFALDIDASEDSTSLLFARSSLVVSSRAVGLPPPIDGVTVRLDETQTVRADTSHAVSLGFGGKLCIHPSQVSIVNAAFAPSSKQVRWAQSVIQQADDGRATVVDGEMVDAPVLARARRILDRLGQQATPEGIK